MSTASGVPIEPPEQTRLLDACVAREGVIGGGVPGGELGLAQCAKLTNHSRWIRRHLYPDFRCSRACIACGTSLARLDRDERVPSGS
jgi:phosphomevalonate kinase